MNRERAKELLPIIQAFAEGKDIQFRYYKEGYEWADMRKDDRFTATFPAEDYEYRIKPEPMEIWVNVYPGRADCFISERKAVDAATQACMHVAKHFREVTE